MKTSYIKFWEKCKNIFENKTQGLKMVLLGVQNGTSRGWKWCFRGLKMVLPGVILWPTPLPLICLQSMTPGSTIFNPWKHHFQPPGLIFKNIYAFFSKFYKRSFQSDLYHLDQHEKLFNLTPSCFLLNYPFKYHTCLL